jgi:hypothetical protein
VACVILIQCMWCVLGIAWVISTQGCREQERTIAAQLGIEIDMTYAVKIPQTTCCPSPLLIYPLLIVSVLAISHPFSHTLSSPTSLALSSPLTSTSRKSLQLTDCTYEWCPCHAASCSTCRVWNTRWAYSQKVRRAEKSRVE